MIASLFSMILLQYYGDQYGDLRASILCASARFPKRDCAQKHTSRTHILLHTVQLRLTIAVGGLLGNVLVPRAGTDEIFDCFDTLDATARADCLAVQCRCGTSKVELPR
jgi:hypothetical protein